MDQTAFSWGGWCCAILLLEPRRDGMMNCYLCGASLKGIFRKRNCEIGFTVVFTKAAPKNLSFQYISHQFRIYPHPLITPILNCLDRVFPNWAREARVTLPLGVMLVVGHV
jgi:hypothetical protein